MNNNKPYRLLSLFSHSFFRSLSLEFFLVLLTVAGPLAGIRVLLENSLMSLGQSERRDRYRDSERETDGKRAAPAIIHYMVGCTWNLCSVSLTPQWLGSLAQQIVMTRESG